MVQTVGWYQENRVSMAVMLHQSKMISMVKARVLFVGFGQNQGVLIGQIMGAKLIDGPVMTTHLQALNHAVLQQTDPQLVICALFAPGSADSGADVVALIERLQALGYAGRIAVLGPDLPRPDLVQAELRALGPGERLTLLVAAIQTLIA